MRAATHAQDRLGDRLEIGAEMHGRFERRGSAPRPARPRHGGTSPGRRPGCAWRRAPPRRRSPRPRTSAIGPIWNSRAAIHRPGAGEVAAAEPHDPPLGLDRRLAGITDLGADAASSSAPSPASAASAAASGSTIMPITAPSAFAAISARSSPTVSELPPAPGLSWMSARTTGFVALRASRSASATASSGS